MSQLMQLSSISNAMTFNLSSWVARILTLGQVTQQKYRGSNRLSLARADTQCAQNLSPLQPLPALRFSSCSIVRLILPLWRHQLDTVANGKLVLHFDFQPVPQGCVYPLVTHKLLGVTDWVAIVIILIFIMRTWRRKSLRYKPRWAGLLIDSGCGRNLYPMKHLQSRGDILCCAGDVIERLSAAFNFESVCPFGSGVQRWIM